MTKIQWTDETWNPVRGCSRVSEGCRHCYAERFASRFRGDDDPFYGFAYSDKAGPHWTGKVELIPSMLDKPLHWRKPRRVFVNSMSDLFHEKLSDEAIAAVFGVMAACPQHTFQVLTKRPERARRWFELIEADARAHPAFDGEPQIAYNCFNSALTARRFRLPGWSPKPWPLSNVWLGVSVEDQETADKRIPLLLQTPAAVRFVSYEPALGPVDFRAIPMPQLGSSYWNPLLPPPPDAGGPWAKLGKIDWLIYGGESGPGARPNDVAWARSARDQCKAAGVPFFMKQFGAKARGIGTDPSVARVSDHPSAQQERFDLDLHDRKGGDPSEWPEDLRVREFPR